MKQLNYSGVSNIIYPPNSGSPQLQPSPPGVWLVSGLVGLTVSYWSYYLIRYIASCICKPRSYEQLKQDRVLRNNLDNYGTLQVEDESYESSFYVSLLAECQDLIK